MKSMRVNFVFLMIVLFVPFFLSAQERNGYVTDRKGTPLDMATVALFAGERQAAVAVADTAGRFVFSVADGKYVMKIRNITYKSLEQMIDIKSGMVDMGIFVLEESAVDLNEVVVSASMITREADRFVLRVNNVPSMLNKDASEILRLAPGVWIDDTGVYINGMRGTKVFINERELKLPEKELAAYLRNFPSSDIARIEIISQAGAEYSADSQGGVIRIILRKQPENGVGGNLILGTSQGKYFRDYKPSGTVNARIGRLMLNAFASGNFRTKSESELAVVRVFKDEEEHRFQSRSYMHQKMNYGVGRMGAVYEPDNKNSFGAEWEAAYKRTKNPSSAKTVIKEDGPEINGNGDYQQDEGDRNISATFNYIYRMDTLGSVLKFIADYTDKKVTGDNDYHSFSEIKGVVGGIRDFTVDSVYGSASSSDYRVLTTDLSLYKQLGHGMNFAAGVKYTRNDMSDTASYVSLYHSEWKPLQDYSFSINYTEDIGAVYGTLAVSKGGLSLSAGVRGEYTCVKGKGDGFRHSYFDLFPNANVTYSFNAMRTFMLIGQYSRNIQRPNFWYLNPNRIQYSDYSYMIGNPGLRPTYIHRFGMTAVYKYRYVLSTGGSLHRDLIREVCRIDPANPDVTFITPENHHMENHYYLALSFPLSPADWCSANFNLVGVKQDIRGTENDEKTSHYLYFNNITTNFTLPQNFFLEISYSGTSRLYSANSGVNPRHLLNVAFKKRLLDDRITALLGIDNIFDSKASYFSKMERFTANTDGREAWSSKFVKLSVQYNFKTGKSFKKRVIESSSGSEKERLEKSENK
ncbi:MAG: TonB-dependent receptor family protein [Tannerella sp.]|jgi:outer membrane receptor protein involved in Fe transport|nr:TonB-dependent receptor family protein [Tannerella sp.]